MRFDDSEVDIVDSREEHAVARWYDVYRWPHVLAETDLLCANGCRRPAATGNVSVTFTSAHGTVATLRLGHYGSVRARGVISEAR
ncbi:protein of unknown function (plasmid) [Pseudorhizobium banfieldiae]|uniref:Uncharacterized protein n=1 Tax=Pseudorhizobium banfieldiae TaxID=1125847 RepID=L0NNR3_9HYPH|nr:protein of unknown function [Pseudorhizobium banfieldiae]